MGGSTLNREDYKSAIPQLSAQLDEILKNNVIINRTVITLSEGKVSDLNNYLGYFQNLTTGYFQAIAGDIEYLSSREAYINHLKADIASFGYLTAETADLRYATISNLNAAVARIGNLEADHVSVADLTAATGRISDLEADHVSVSDLAATNADVAHLKVGDLTIGGVTVNIYDLAIAIKNSAMASGTTWYKVSASTPTAPVVFDPTSDGWSQTEPAYVGGTADHLYSCLRVVYADDDPLGTRHFQWSDVHMIQSWEAAKSAYSYAGDAAEAANKAVKDLSQVENVVGVVNWIAEHGEMISQAGGTFDPAKVYFIVDPNGDYHIGNTHYSVVAEPKAEDIDDYYILNIDESVQNYVMTHLFVDREGLWLIPDSGFSKVLISTGRSQLYNSQGMYVVTRYSAQEPDFVLAKFTANGALIKGSLGVGDDVEAGFNSVAIGNRAKANTPSALAVGLGVEATSPDSLVVGRWNQPDNNPVDPYGYRKYIFIVGNGSYQGGTKSNAFTVDWQGNAEAQGDVTAQGYVMAQGWAGFVQMYAGSTAPTGWLFCDGSEVAVADYPLLYAVVGNMYGTPSDSDHFLLPDLRGRTPIGAGQGTGLTNRSLGGEVGAETHKLKGNESGQKSVSISSSGGHTHTVTSYYREVANYGSGSAARPYSQSGSSSTTNWSAIGSDTGKHTHSISASDATNAHNNMQPSLGINFIICTGETS